MLTQNNGALSAHDMLIKFAWSSVSKKGPICMYFGIYESTMHFGNCWLKPNLIE